MLEEKQEHEFTLLINDHISNLPQDYRTWIDWEQSLPEGIYFFPRRPSWSSLIFGLVFGTVIIGFLIFSNYHVVQAVFRGEFSDTFTSLFWVGFNLLALFFGIASLSNFWSEFQVLRAQNKNRLRHGLFLGYDSLLIWLADNSCHLIPRKILKSVKSESLRSSRSNYNGTFNNIRLIFDDDVGEAIEKVFGFVVFQSKYLEESDSAIVRFIQNWIDEYDGPK